MLRTTVVLLLLAFLTTGQGIIMDADKSFNLPGIEVGFKYKDAANPLKGGQLHFDIEDLKKYINKVDLGKVRVYLDFTNGKGDTVGDGQFQLEFNYLFGHDGDQQEKGKIEFSRWKQSNNGGVMLWTTRLTSESAPFSGQPVLPKSLSNLEIEVAFDRQYHFGARYINRVAPWNAERQVGLRMTSLVDNTWKAEVISDGSKLVDVNANITRTNVLEYKKCSPGSPGCKNYLDEINLVEVEGTILEDPVKGSIIAEGGLFQDVKIEIEKGNKKLLQISVKLVWDPESHKDNKKAEVRIKYSILGGTIAGKIIAKIATREGLKLKIIDNESKDSLEFIAMFDPVNNGLHFEGKRNGESMWTYEYKKEEKKGPNSFEMNTDTVMNLNSKSAVYKFLSSVYPYAAFNNRHNKVAIFVDPANSVPLAPVLKVDIQMEKDGASAVDFKIDTTGRPYLFHLASPYFFRRLGIQSQSIDIKVDHSFGSALTIEANIFGGILIEAKHKNNANNGKDFILNVGRGGVYMIEFNGHTEKINNDKEFKLILRDDVKINPNSILYKNIISQYKFLTPFNNRTGEFEFYINKQANTVLLNKFSVKGKVMKDDKKAMELIFSTMEQPYKFELFAPALFKNIRPDMTSTKITMLVDNFIPLHLGMDESTVGSTPQTEARIMITIIPSMFKVLTNFQKIASLKIYQSGTGNERKVELNGEELASGDYTLTDNSFSTKITLGNDFLEPKITWEGKLPENRNEAEAFLLKNNVVVKVTGSKRNLDLSLNWEMTKPDMDFGTPENGKIKLDAKGNNPRWGDYTLSRDIEWSVANRVLDVKINGLAQMQQGTLATSNPIETAVNFKVIIDEADLVGKFMKKIEGKEYSIEFPQGSGAWPKIKMGQ